MAKDPAFLFYPGDWNLGTMHLTILEKGAYIELLILQFAKGKFTKAQAKHMLNGSFDLAWPSISDKFNTDGTFFWNERLQVEKEKRQKFTDSRRSNGSIRKEPKKDDKHMLKHMEDENENENSVVTNYSNTVTTAPEKSFLWTDQVKNFNNDFRWKEKFCRDKNIRMPALEKLMAEYLSDIELKEDFKETRELKNHFTNWYNKKSKNGFTDARNEQKLGTSQARTEALRDWGLKAE